MQFTGANPVRDLGIEQSVGVLPPKSVAVVFGTRPEIIKLARVITLLGESAWTVFSGQHFDRNLSGDFFDELGLPEPDETLGVGGRSRGAQIAQTVAGLDELFSAHRPLAVVVQGDTNTAVGGALAANAAEVFLAHVEAGLRSHDRRMPEEHNRVLTDHLADICWAPTGSARANLMAEGIPDTRISVTGNTVIDMIARLLPEPDVRAETVHNLELHRSRFILATFHRPENVDDAARLATILEELASIDAPVLLPVHPRTRRRIEEFGLEEWAGRLRTLPPLGYRTFLALAAESACLVSDSGGVQEEASFVKRPVLVVRRSTERPEVVGTFATLEPSLENIGAIANQWLAALPEIHERLACIESPYGDGAASERCVNDLVSRLRPEAADPANGAGDP